MTTVTEFITADNLATYQANRKPERGIPAWLAEEMRENKRQEYYEMKAENEEREEREQLNDWINSGGY